MTGRPVLVIFVDGLPFGRIGQAETPFLALLQQQTSVQPGMGYSINIYYELFAGRRPDAAGFWNKWCPCHGAPTKWGLPAPLMRLFDVTRFHPFLSRATHIAYQRMFGTPNIANIPFRYLPQMEHLDSGEIFDIEEPPTIFNRTGMPRFLSTDHKGSGIAMERDAGALNAFLAQQDPVPRQAFVMLGDLDEVGHKRGPDHPMYAESLRLLDSRIRQLAEHFRAAHGEEATIVVTSDHGMSQVHTARAVKPERALGRSGRDTYLYFVDSVYLRFWVRDRSLLPRVEKYVQGLGFGVILDAQERKIWGLTSEAFGDFILRLDEGEIFFPGFMGGRFTRGMHGYHPKLPEQQGVLLVDGGSSRPGLESCRSIDVYDELVRITEPPI